MAGTVEYNYRDLLNPSKDPDKCFQIDISRLLHDYVSELSSGKRPPNFNSAALLLQGSASIYGKKVEYLYNLANQLYNTLIKQRDTPQSDKKTKDKKADKSMNPFFSTDVKVGKNLSVLRRRNAPKSTTKKLSKRLKSSNIPVLLLTAENEDKGEIFNDTRGEAVGNQSDYALNLCSMTNSGWLMLPTVNPNLIPADDTLPEYYNETVEIAEQIIRNGIFETPNAAEDMDDDGIDCSPDEGFESQPTSVPSQPSSTPGMDTASSQDTPTPTMDTSAPPSTDEGIESTPAEDVGSCQSPGGGGIENMPTDVQDMGTLNSALKPIRQSVRQALKQCQLAQEEDPLSGPIAEKHMVVRKKIQKKNTRCLPSRLKTPQTEDEGICISEYCARTFFWNEEKNLKNSLLAFEVHGFHQNSKFMKRMKERIDALKSKQILRKKTIEPIEDDIRDVDVEGIEFLQDGEGDDDTLCVPFEDGDVQIDNDPANHPNTSSEDMDARSTVDDVNPVELTSPDISLIAFQECEKYTKEVQQFIQNSDITERVHSWEKSVKPFLEEMDQRESFDINLYGARILNSFEDNNRKQTITFEDFCEGKEKWEIHRYFMALLPLANIGNVSIESKRKPDGSDQIFVTLLSRKMHHKELEEFGHSDGTHS